MATTMKKVVFPIQIAEADNQYRTKAGGGLSASILKAGATHTGADFAGDAVALLAATFTVDTLGELAVGANLDVFDATNSAARGYSLTVGTITYDAADDNYDVTFSAAAGAVTFDIDDGDRFVFTNIAGNRLSLFDDASGDNVKSNPVVLGVDGMLQFYAREERFDLYVSGPDVTDNYVAFDVPIGQMSASEINLAFETVASGAAVQCARDTTLLFVTGSSTISTLADADDNRLLFLIPTGAGIGLSVVSTVTADNQFYAAASGTLSLVQDRPLFLVSRTSGGFRYWAVQAGGAALSFTDLSDVNEPSPVVGDLVQFDGSEYVGAKSFGALANPITSGHVLHTGFKLVNGSSFALGFNAAALTTDRTLTLPDISGTLILSTGTQTVSGQKTFDDSASGLRIKSLTGTDRVVRFDVSAIDNSTVRTVSFPNKDITVADAADVPTVANDLSDFTKGSPTDGQVVIWSTGSGDFRPSSTIGSVASKLTGTFRDLRIHASAGSFHQKILSQGLNPADEEYYLPPSTPTASDILLARQATGQVVTGDITFDDDAFVVRDPSATTKKARLDVGAVAAGNTRVVSVPDRDIDLDDVRKTRLASFTFDGSTAFGYDVKLAAANALPLFYCAAGQTITRVVVVVDSVAASAPSGTLQLYYGAALPTSSTVPPASSTAILNTALDLSTIGGSVEYNFELANTASFVAPNVPSSNWVYLSIASAVTWGGLSSGTITVLVEYEETF